MSKLSRNIFWACWDHIVAQKSIFQKKKSEKVANAIPPPWLATGVIWRHLEQLWKMCQNRLLARTEPTTPYRAKWPKNSHFCRLRDFFVPQGVEKCVKCENNIKNVFSNLKLTLENIMDHWNDLVWSIFKKVQKNGQMRDLGW